MKKMKKFAALLLAVSMAAGMVACGSSDKKEETTKKEETKKDDKETKKLEGTLKVVTTGDAYQPLFDKFTEEVGPKVESFPCLQEKFYQSLKQKAEHLQLTCGSGAESMHLWMQKIMTFLKK